MRRPFTIGRAMLVVAVAAADLALVRLFLVTGVGLGGLLAVGLAISAAVLAAALAGPGAVRRFAFGFLGAVGLILVGLVLLLILGGTAAQEGFLAFANASVRSFEAPIRWWNGPRRPDESPTPTFLAVEAGVGLPLVLLACLGGFAALATRRRRPPQESPSLPVDHAS